MRAGFAGQKIPVVLQGRCDSCLSTLVSSETGSSRDARIVCFTTVPTARTSGRPIKFIARPNVGNHRSVCGKLSTRVLRAYWRGHLLSIFVGGGWRMGIGRALISVADPIILTGAERAALGIASFWISIWRAWSGGVCAAAIPNPIRKTANSALFILSATQESHPRCCPPRRHKS